MIVVGGEDWVMVRRKGVDAFMAYLFGLCYGYGWIGTCMIQFTALLCISYDQNMSMSGVSVAHLLFPGVPCMNVADTVNVFALDISTPGPGRRA
jgi:hypothetical protein